MDESAQAVLRCVGITFADRWRATVSEIEEILLLAPGCRSWLPDSAMKRFFIEPRSHLVVLLAARPELRGLQDEDLRKGSKLLVFPTQELLEQRTDIDFPFVVGENTSEVLFASSELTAELENTVRCTVDAGFEQLVAKAGLLEHCRQELSSVVCRSLSEAFSFHGIPEGIRCNDVEFRFTVLQRHALTIPVGQLLQRAPHRVPVICCAHLCALYVEAGPLAVQQTLQDGAHVARVPHVREAKVRQGLFER